MICDRCHNEFEGDEDYGAGFTSGYYNAKAFPQFTNKDEKIICDWCIHTDARYIKAYGKTAESKHKEEFEKCKKH